MSSTATVVQETRRNSSSRLDSYRHDAIAATCPPRTVPGGVIFCRDVRAGKFAGTTVYSRHLWTLNGYACEALPQVVTALSRHSRDGRFPQEDETRWTTSWIPRVLHGDPAQDGATSGAFGPLVQGGHLGQPEAARLRWAGVEEGPLRARHLGHARRLVRAKFVIVLGGCALDGVGVLW